MLELAADSLQRTGRLRLRVTGWSMLPAIRPADILEVRRAEASEVVAGRIVLFQREGRFFAHRVVRREHGRLVTRGDTLPSEDSPLDERELLGEVIAIERCGRTAMPQAKWIDRAGAFLFRRSDLAARLFTRWCAA